MGDKPPPSRRDIQSPEEPKDSVAVLTGTSGVAINNSGTLLFSANNQLNQAIPPDISLGSGSGTAKIDAGGFSQGGSGTTGNAGLGALTLNSNAIIDLTNTSVLHFADSTGETWTGTLSILNWSGAPIIGGGWEQILFGTGGILPGVDPTQLSQIQFIDPVGFAAGIYSAIYAGTNLNEIVPGAPDCPSRAPGSAARWRCRRSRSRSGGASVVCSRAAQFNWRDGRCPVPLIYPINLGTTQRSSFQRRGLDRPHAISSRDR